MMILHISTSAFLAGFKSHYLFCASVRKMFNIPALVAKDAFSVKSHAIGKLADKAEIMSVRLFHGFLGLF
jgi:hypothetical protein